MKRGSLSSRNFSILYLIQIEQDRLKVKRMNKIKDNPLLFYDSFYLGGYRRTQKSNILNTYFF
jgi:hypothetical protein